MSNYIIPMLLVVLGAISSVAGSLWLTSLQAKERHASSDARAKFETELRGKSDEIAALNREIATAVTVSSDARAAFEKELRSKNEEIARLNERTAASVTGGDSWCYLAPLRPDLVVNGVKVRSGTGFELMLFHQGQYPLYDVGIRIEDSNRVVRAVLEAQQRGQLPFATSAEAEANIRSGVLTLNVGNLAPSTGLTIGPIEFADGDSQTYRVSIMARNGSISELVRWERVAGDWKMAFRVVRDGHTLKEYVDDGFPLEPGSTKPW